jgi:2,3-bisphosphoglycerate-independent phosphoglycerate mutase
MQGWTIETNYAGKVEAALKALERMDFVYLHIEAPDEAAHEGDLELKIKALEIFDREVVGPIIEGLMARGDDWRVLLLPDHATPIEIKTHSHDPVPFAIMGKGIKHDTIESFDEGAATQGGYEVVEATELVGMMTKV